MLQWKQGDLHCRALLTFQELSRYHESLKALIERDGITKDSSSLDHICAPLMPKEATNTHIPGYKRLMSILFAILGTVIFVIIVDVL